MDEEIKETVEEIQEEVVEETKEEQTPEQVEEQEKESRQGVLNKIAGIFKKDKEEVQEEQEETQKEQEVEASTQEPAEQYEEIDPFFVEQARQYGWSDEKTKKYSEDHSEIDIVSMADKMFQTNQRNSQTLPDEEKEEVTDPLDTLEVEDEKVASILKKVVEPLSKRIEEQSAELQTLREGVSEEQKSREEKEVLRNIKDANQIFDDAGLFGKTDQLPRYPDGNFVSEDPAVKKRQEVWNVATMFYSQGGSFKEAMNNAVRWYKGSGVKKELEKEVLTKLEKQQDSVFPKRTTQKMTKTYVSEEERKADIVQSAIDKHQRG